MILRFLLLLFSCLIFFEGAYAQLFKRNQESKEEQILEESRDDLFALLSTEQFPYIEKFHLAVREKLSGNLSEAKKLFEECKAEYPHNDAVYFGLAEIAKRQKQKSLALEYMENAHELDPENIHYVQELAMLLFEKAEFQKASDFFEILVREEPRHAEWQYAYAQCLIYNKEYEQALERFQIIEDLMGIVPELTMIKIDLLQETNRTDEVENELLQLKKAFPNNLEILKTVIGYYEEQEETEKAIALIKELVKKEPENGVAHFILANQAIELNEISDYLNSLKIVVGSEDLDVRDKVRITQPLYEITEGNEEAIIEIMETFSLTHDKEAVVLSMFGDLLVQLKQSKRALDFYRASLAYNKNRVELWTNILAFQSAYKEYAALYEDAKEAIDYFPTIPFIYYAAAEGAMYAGKLEDAMDYLEIGEIYLIDDVGQLARYAMRKGEILYRQGENKKAKAKFDEALTKAPNEEIIINSFAYHLARFDKDYKKAEQLLLPLLDNELVGSKVIYSLGFVYLKQKNYDKAITLLEEALEKQSYTAEIHDLLGDIYVVNKDIDKALHHWKKAKEEESRNTVIPQKIEDKKFYAPNYF